MLVYLEGLWHTGKSYCLGEIQSRVSHSVLVHTDARRLGSIRHAAFVLYPRIFPDHHHVFDRSPITLKVLAGFSFYESDEVNPKYWLRFYDEWLETIRESDHRIVIIYFQPFQFLKFYLSEIFEYISTCEKSDLLIDKTKIFPEILHTIHDYYLQEIKALERLYGQRRIRHYRVDYRNTKAALAALELEGLFSSNDKSSGEEKCNVQDSHEISK